VNGKILDINTKKLFSVSTGKVPEEDTSCNISKIIAINSAMSALCNMKVIAWMVITKINEMK
jgi:hypothetical protein